MLLGATSPGVWAGAALRSLWTSPPTTPSVAAEPRRRRGSISPRAPSPSVSWETGGGQGVGVARPVV